MGLNGLIENHINNQHFLEVAYYKHTLVFRTSLLYAQGSHTSTVNRLGPSSAWTLSVLLHDT